MLAAASFSCGALISCQSRPTIRELHDASMNGDTGYCGKSLTIAGSVAQVHRYSQDLADYYVENERHEFVSVRYDPRKTNPPNVGDHVSVSGFLTCDDHFGHPVQSGTRNFNYDLVEVSR